MRLAPDEPDCLVPALSHAWVPEKPQPMNTDETKRATCGRCGMTRVLHASGRITYWTAPVAKRACAED